MTPEQLLIALNDIDGKSIREAKVEQTPAKRFSSRRFAALLAAVIALVAMTVTAFAAEDIAGWFREYFTRNAKSDLTPGQIEYIEENEQIVAETLEHNGYSLELKSVLSDSNTVYVTIGIAAPDALPFDDATTISSQEIDLYDNNHNMPQTLTLRLIDDADGSDTTADLMLEFNLGSWNSSNLWTLSIKKLTGIVYDKEYEQQLLDTKYAGQTNIMFTDEEAAQIYRDITLVEGPWEFTIDLSKASTGALELITEPILARSCCGFRSDGTLVFEDITITSVILRPLSATIHTEYTASRSAPDFTPTSEYQIFVVMNDSSRIQLYPDWGMTGQAHYTAVSPIILEEVDHILLPDGTKLMAP